MVGERLALLHVQRRQNQRVPELNAVLAALLSGGILAASATVFVSIRELRLKRLLEATALFMQVATTAHGYRGPDNGHVGLGEQIAAVHLIGVLGSKNRHLRTAAKEFLKRYNPTTFASGSTATFELVEAAHTALRALPGSSEKGAA